jgi:thioredoxin 2
MSESLQLACPQCHAINRLPAERLAAQPRCGRCKQALFNGHPVTLDAASFAAHAERSQLPLLVDFWAPWCGPCLQMAPAFEAAAGRLEPQLRLAKVDTEAQPALASRFAIRSIPTLILFRDGRELARHSGAVGVPDIMRFAYETLSA